MVSSVTIEEKVMPEHMGRVVQNGVRTQTGFGFLTWVMQGFVGCSKKVSFIRGLGESSFSPHRMFIVREP